MKRRNNKLLGACVALLCALNSCSDRPDDLLFKDFFVYVVDENGLATSQILSTSDNLVITYYFNLVSETISEPLTVNFDLVVGDGLQQGVDFNLQNDVRSITFEPGIYKKPFRMNFKKHQLDPAKDNTIKIVITSTSDPNITIGYPGPSAKFSSHTITKRNP